MASIVEQTQADIKALQAKFDSGDATEQVVDSYQKKLEDLVNVVVGRKPEKGEMVALNELQAVIHKARGHDNRAEMSLKNAGSYAKSAQEFCLPATQDWYLNYYKKRPVLKLTKHTGALLMWQQQYYRFDENPEDVRPVFQKIMIHNFAFGWWSVMSLFINPIVILLNIYRWFVYKAEYRDFYNS